MNLAHLEPYIETARELHRKMPVFFRLLQFLIGDIQRKRRRSKRPREARSNRRPEERMRLRKDRDAQDRFYRQHLLPPDSENSQERIVDVTHLADLVDYLVKLIGADQIGMGGDVNGIDDHQWPSGMDHIGELPNLTAELLL